jgi:hypothetical protein
MTRPAAEDLEGARARRVRRGVGAAVQRALWAEIE